MEGVLPAYDKAELEKDTPEGSDADYRLYDADGNTINAALSVSGRVRMQRKLHILRWKHLYLMKKPEL